MESSTQEKIYIFDSLYTNEHIQLMKILYHSFPLSMKKAFAPIIKYMELQYTIKLTKSGFPISCNENADCNSKTDNLAMIKSIIEDLTPYLSEDDKKNIRKLEDIYHMFSTFQQLQKTLGQFEDMTGIPLDKMMSGDFMSDSLLKGLLNTEQFNMFETLFPFKGDTAHE